MKWVSIVAVLALLGLQAAGYAGTGAQLGVMVDRLDGELAGETDYEGKGVFVVDVIEDTAAEKAGIRDHDIIVEVDGKQIIGTGHLVDLLGYYAPGDKVKVKVWRDGKTITVTAELGEKKKVECKELVTGAMGPKAWLGVKVQSLTEQLGDHFGTDKGVLVSEVFEDSPAKRAGLEAGDVITEVDGKETDSPEILPKHIHGKEPGDRVTVALIRDGKELTKEVELAEAPADFAKKAKVIMCRGGHDEGPCCMGPHGMEGFKGLQGMKVMKILKGCEDSGESHVEVVAISGDVEELRGEVQQLKQELEELKKALKESK